VFTEVPLRWRVDVSSKQSVSTHLWSLSLSLAWVEYQAMDGTG
jgi:hypothetical protein